MRVRAAIVAGGPANIRRNYGVPPATGYVHRAWDCFLPKGLPVRAPDDGEITSARPDVGTDPAIVDTDNGGYHCHFRTVTGDQYYVAHLDGPVRLGPYAAGSRFGTTGYTGNARTKGTEPHAHIELALRDDSGRLWRADPMPVFAWYAGFTDGARHDGATFRSALGEVPRSILEAAVDEDAPTPGTQHRTGPTAQAPARPPASLSTVVGLALAVLAELAAAPEDLSPPSARDFQAAVGLSPDGEIGPITAGALEYYTGATVAGVVGRPFTPGPGIAAAPVGSAERAVSRVVVAGAAIALVRGLA